MGQFIDDLLQLSRLSRTDIRHQRIDLSGAAREVADGLHQREPGRKIAFVIEPGVGGFGDLHLLRLVLENLLGNAWKFTARHPKATVVFGRAEHEGGPAYFVRDAGAGFDMAFAGKLFGAFQRLHSDHDFPGTGIGLAIVQRVIHRHGGRVWGEGAVERGATFWFTLPSEVRSQKSGENGIRAVHSRCHTVCRTALLSRPDGSGEPSYPPCATRVRTALSNPY